MTSLAQDNPALSSILGEAASAVGAQASASAEAGLSQAQTTGGSAYVDHLSDHTTAGGGRRLYADLTPTLDAFAASVTRHPVMGALRNAPISGVTVTQCASVCESLRRTNPPPAPPPLGDELFGNERTRLAQQKQEADAQRLRDLEQDALGHDDDPEQCHAYAFRRINPGDPFDETVDCYLLHSTGHCTRSTSPPR